MDSQPSGNKHEILINTPKLDVIIDYSRASEKKKAASFIDDTSLFVGGAAEEIKVEERHKRFIFHEYTDYDVLIQGDRGVEIEFFHENPLIRRSLVRRGTRGNNLLDGTINFRGDIGKTEFLIRADGEDYLKIVCEVYPSKMDYKEDYQALLDDVSNEMYNLAYDFLRRTYLSMDIKDSKGETPNEFYSILNYVFQRFTKSLEVIMSQPHHQLIKEQRVQRAHKVKGAGKETLNWLLRNPNGHIHKSGGFIPERALMVKKQVTYDTKENRFLKHILRDITKRLDSFERTYKNSCKGSSGRGRNIDEMVVENVDTMRSRLKRYLSTTFLKEVGDMRLTHCSITQVFSMGMGYRDVYRYYLMIQKGLSLNGEVFRLSMKELSTLYEYWCFIKINSILRKKYKVRSADFLKINRSGLFVTLKKGVQSRVVYEDGEETFTIWYNSERKTKTILQKPDNIFTIDKETRDGKILEFVFDAKYKIDTRSEYINKYGSAGPKEEDINTMHRYRDALSYQIKDKYSSFIENKRAVEAVVLFPHKDEDGYKKNHFFKSIEQVGIGGLPFLPGSTSEVEKTINRIIENS
ncbi:DUF2357 domain-containing protein [Oceanirhabdus sp. W0125-5]|uniref:DUF2357 domain-containing protein n=1 Tax=Oceanirhabdus sp. W0125-5 TaxID=2999116 RepID=UPI0022F3472E|nr:DUF2357 domain-containing protein [Oceanirhabdus sp. W0125-5]WBW96239.1 DUF2357 domain-containing protein [Oceanirhabdus sp. W0125-5]